MSLIRRGHIPHSPHGVSEAVDHVYTLKGFFGDWVHVFREHNLGFPKSWSDDALMYAGLDANVLRPTDLDDARGHPLPLLTGPGLAVSLSRRAEAMPFCERNLDAHEIRFYHRGSARLETELGEMEVTEGDIVVVGKGLIYREVPADGGVTVLIFEVEEQVALAERLWDSVGYASMFIDYSTMGLPELNGSGGSETETEVRVKDRGRYQSLVYDFDPCRDVTGWLGDPVLYKMSAWDVPAIGTARGFLPPPAHAVLYGEDKGFFFNVLTPSPMPTIPAPEGAYGAPAHQNDYDEVWLNHVSEFAPHTDGHVWLLPRTIPHPGSKRPPKYPKNPVQQFREMKINFDTRGRLEWTEEAKAGFLPGDVRVACLQSMYGVPTEYLPENLKQYL